jgi:hypothetical protein
LNDGSLYRAPVNMTQLTNVLPAPTTVRDMVVDVATTTTEVFVLRVNDVLRCAGTCTSPTDFSPVATIGGVETGATMCARGDRVLFTTHLNAISKLYELQRPMLSFGEVSPDLGVDRAARCFIDELGVVYVPGDANNVARWSSAGGLMNETINTGTHGAASWRDVVSGPAGAFIVGGGSGYRFAVRGGSAWNDLAPDTRGTVMTAVLGAGDEVYAGGNTNSSSAATPFIYKWNGVTFAPLAVQPYAIDVTRGLAVSPNELYFAGVGRTSGSHEILRGTR